MITPKTFSTQLLFVTTQIVAQHPDGRESKGTGFFFRLKIDDQRSVPVLVTNKHVVKGATRGIFQVHEQILDDQNQPIPSDSSLTFTVPDFEKQWIGHPGNSDLCVMPFEPLRLQASNVGKTIYCKWIDESLIPSQQILENLSALEDVTMVGYPIGLWDSHGNLPLLRRGITSSHPGTDWCGKPEGLVDIAAFPGSSGSPILIVNEGTYATSQGITVGFRAFFLGILYAGPQHAANGSIQIVTIPTSQVPITQTQIPSHLGYYIKARELLTLKNHMFTTLNIS